MWTLQISIEIYKMCSFKIVGSAFLVLTRLPYVGSTFYTIWDLIMHKILWYPFQYWLVVRFFEIAKCCSVTSKHTILRLQVDLYSRYRAGYQWSIDQQNAHWQNRTEVCKLCLIPTNSIILSVLRYGKDQHGLCKYREPSALCSIFNANVRSL